MSIYTHTQVPLPEGAVFKISPSQIASFFEYPVNWYKSEVLGESTFKGNTATVLGTSIHYVLEQYALAAQAGKEVDKVALKKTIADDLRALDNPDVNKSEVLECYEDMARELINAYLIDNIPTHTELSVVAEVSDGIYVGGSIDSYDEKTAIITDYKSAGKKPSENIPWNYYIQLMAYAYAIRAQGKPIDRIRLAYVIRPTKTIGIRTQIVTHQITDSDWKSIEDVLTIITDTIKLSNSNPEFNYLLFKSMQLKEN